MSLIKAKIKTNKSKRVNKKDNSSLFRSKLDIFKVTHERKML